MSNRNIETSRAYRNKNPLNIRSSKVQAWHGETGHDEKGFVKFGAFSFCYRAALMILRTYRKRHAVTLQDIIHNWAPPTENATDKYVEAICRMLPPRTSEPYVIEPATVIDLKNRNLVCQILYAMTRVETGWSVVQAQFIKPYIEMGYDLAVTRPDFFK